MSWHALIFGADVRWIVEVFRDEIGGDLVEQRVLSCEQAVDGHHTIRTSLTLHAARYQIVAWMDYVDNGSTADKYYNVNSLSSISVPEAGNYIGDEDHKDTYIAQQEIDLKNYRDRWNETVDATVTLQRPMAKIEFITTDIDKFLDKLAARRTPSSRYSCKSCSADFCNPADNLYTSYGSRSTESPIP